MGWAQLGVVEVRIVGSAEWAIWRALRLAALAEAPYAFSSTLADWQGKGDTEARWSARLTAVPFNVVVELDAQPAGMVSATEPDSAQTIEVLSMWVAPFARGRGVGDALIEAVVGWAGSRSARRLELRVMVGNEKAVALYRRHGFTETGLVSQNPDGSREAEMVRDMNGQPPEGTGTGRAPSL